MPIAIRVITIGDDLVENYSARSINACTRAGYEALGRHWIRRYLPLHFRSGNATRYKMQPRSAAWIKRKQKKGRQVLLIDRGTLKALVLGGASLRAYPSRATVTLPGPTYLNARPNPRGRGRNRPNMAREILEVRDDELQELSRVGGDAFRKALESRRRVKRKVTA